MKYFLVYLIFLSSLFGATMSDVTVLDVVSVGNPVLRVQAKELSPAEILGPQIQGLITQMRHTMKVSQGVGLAAPQVNQPIQLVVIEDMDHDHLSAEDCAATNRQAIPFHVIINPRLSIPKDAKQVEFFEGCLSIPELMGVVSRAEEVRVECLNERAQPVVIEARGWYARILQHEIDHLQGVLYTDRVQPSTLMTTENYLRFWKDKSIPEIQHALAQVKIDEPLVTQEVEYKLGE